MKVRRIQAIKFRENFFEAGDIHVEYGDNPGVFYQEKFGPDQSGIGLPDHLINNMGFEEYFIELDPIDFKLTARFSQIKHELEEEFNSIDDQVESLESQITQLKERKHLLTHLLF